MLITLKDIKKTDAYWVEKATIDFVSDLYEQLEKKNLSKADFARLIGKSKAYVTKVLSGEENFTIKTMVKLSRALGSHLHLNIYDKPQALSWQGVTQVKKRVAAPQPVFIQNFVGEVAAGINVLNPKEKRENETTALAA